ncbi:hypothetical protein WICMUC_002010 [Wickerhamomyces mucosus]|uniref:Presequence translocated-associated motor subunit PAM17 n=1 Tax=Wickerhamomyces mucosus TaxID=1378264 RepID=A0A9P8PSA4_9ASCO|nr:hypothetical protein WICMUC_002010 [Wickerhamomyces mucosus]
MFNLSVRSAVQRQLLSTQISSIRSFSSVSSRLQSTSTTTTTTTTSTSPNDHQQLNWVEFFKLRKQQRNINIGSSIATALIGSSISWSYISQIEIDPTQLIFGFDPFMIYFAGFITTSGVGYLFGPLLGNLIFNLTKSKNLNSFKQKQKLFLEKVKQNRVDPSSQSFNNPVPDYYGEKIQSLKDYKQWLRDNYAYKRKSQEFL